MMVWPYGAKYQIHFLEPETIQGRVKDPPDSPPQRYAWLSVFLLFRLASSKSWLHCSNRMGAAGMCPNPIWQSTGNQSPGPKPCHMGSSDIIHLAWISTRSRLPSAATRIYYGAYTLAWAKWLSIYLPIPSRAYFPFVCSPDGSIKYKQRKYCTSRYGGDSPVEDSAGACW